MSKTQPEYEHLTSGQMSALRRSYATGKTVRQLAIKYGIAEATVRRVISRATTR
jgi:Mor family transcriptional regulator